MRRREFIAGSGAMFAGSFSTNAVAVFGGAINRPYRYFQCTAVLLIYRDVKGCDIGTLYPTSCSFPVRRERFSSLGAGADLYCQ